MSSRPSGRRRKLAAPLTDDPFADDRGLAKRKLRQLCRQVERALSLALGSDCHDPVLLDLAVDQVLPWPNASRLLVTVRPTSPELSVDRTEVLAHLEAQKSVLRGVVAETIHRKRTPELCFEVFASEA